MWDKQAPATGRGQGAGRLSARRRSLRVSAQHTEMGRIITSYSQSFHMALASASPIQTEHISLAVIVNFLEAIDYFHIDFLCWEQRHYRPVLEAEVCLRAADTWLHFHRGCGEEASLFLTLHCFSFPQMDRTSEEAAEPMAIHPISAAQRASAFVMLLLRVTPLLGG